MSHIVPHSASFEKHVFICISCTINAITFFNMPGSSRYNCMYQAHVPVTEYSFYAFVGYMYIRMCQTDLS